MNERDTDAHILITKEKLLIALVHLARLLLSQTVDDFIFIQQESLADIERRNSRIIERSELGSVILVRQHTFSRLIEEMNTSGFRIHFHPHSITAQCHVFAVFIESYRGSFGSFDNDQTFFIVGCLHRCFINPDDGGRIKFHTDVHSLCSILDALGRALHILRYAACSNNGRRYQQETDFFNKIHFHGF